MTCSSVSPSSGNNQGFLDGGFLHTDKRIAFTAADVFLRRNGFYIKVEGAAGYDFISGSMERGEFRFAQIVKWISRHLRPLKS